MRRVLLVLSLFFVGIGVSSAADPATVIQSAAPLEGAIEGISDLTIISHLPGYGLQINARWLGDFDLSQIIEQLAGSVAGLSPLIRGLDSGDLVSVAWLGRTFGGRESTQYVVARMVPGDADTLEVFVNGSPLDW